ncbi:hypothetical protein ETR14_19235 [Sphingosinicella sp. BN140058]|nr:hypothetical protein ETR14_19235 [Sphingosinicella sp. BN140058]
MLGAALTAAAAGCAAAGARAAAESTLLGAGATAVPLAIGRGNGRPIVIVEGVAADAPPRTLYEVQLEGRGGRRAALGTISFFNESGYGGDGSSAPAARHFDATEALAQLGGEAVAVVFVPSSGVTGVAARPDPAAHARVGRVRVERR